MQEQWLLVAAGGFGSFIASFVPTIRDFSRLSEDFNLDIEHREEFQMDSNPKVFDVIKNSGRYDDFGFVIFQLGRGKKKIHPMAFKFESVIEDVFFPTVHIHDGEMHKFENFDHALYCQGGVGSNSKRVNDLKIGDFYDSVRLGILSGQNIVKEEIKGMHINKDTLIKTVEKSIESSLA